MSVVKILFLIAIAGLVMLAAGIVFYKILKTE